MGPGNSKFIQEIQNPYILNWTLFWSKKPIFLVINIKN